MTIEMEYQSYTTSRRLRAKEAKLKEGRAALELQRIAEERALAQKRLDLDLELKRLELQFEARRIELKYTYERAKLEESFRQEMQPEERLQREPEVKPSALLSQILADSNDVQSQLLEPDTQSHHSEISQPVAQHQHCLDNELKRQVGVERQFRQEALPEVRQKDKTEVKPSAHLSPTLAAINDVQRTLLEPEVGLNVTDTLSHTSEKSQPEGGVECQFRKESQPEAQTKYRLDNNPKRQVGVKRQFPEETKPVVQPKHPSNYNPGRHVGVKRQFQEETKPVVQPKHRLDINLKPHVGVKRQFQHETESVVQPKHRLENKPKRQVGFEPQIKWESQPEVGVERQFQKKAQPEVRPKREPEVQTSALLSPVVVDIDMVQPSPNEPEVELNLEPDTQLHTLEKVQPKVQHKQRLDNEAKRHVSVERQFQKEAQPVQHFDGHLPCIPCIPCGHRRARSCIRVEAPSSHERLPPDKIHKDNGHWLT